MVVDLYFKDKLFFKWFNAAVIFHKGKCLEGCLEKEYEIVYLKDQAHLNNGKLPTNWQYSQLHTLQIGESITQFGLAYIPNPAYEQKGIQGVIPANIMLYAYIIVNFIVVLGFIYKGVRDKENYII